MSSRFFIDRPVFASVLSLLIVLTGGVAWFVLPVAQYPELAPPTVRVQATYPGANAETIAQTVAAPLEQEVNGVERMIYMASTSSDGSYQLDVTFETGTNIDMAAVLVQNRVSVAEARLPEEVRRLGVTTRKQSSALVAVIGVHSPSGQHDELVLSNWLNLSLRDAIVRVDGVGGVNVVPNKEYGMRVWLDTEKLEARQLTVQDVTNAIAEQNVQVAAGVLGRQPAPEGTNFELPVDVRGRLKTPEEFERIIVRTTDDGRIVRIEDVGRVELGARDYSTTARRNGQPAAILIVYQLPGANLVDVADAVRATLDELRPTFPPGIDASIDYDASMFIRASLEEVQRTLVEAFVLVFLVVLLFLGSFRATLIPAITIPVSLIGTFLVMAALGFSVNMLTMFALVLAIGIVVDDAIIVVENVERHLAEGKSPRDATIQSMKEISGPIVAITLVLMSVFLPSAALPGLTGEMYRQFALTIAASTGFSALNALTLSPALCALLLKPAHGPPRRRLWNAPFRWIRAGFERANAALVHGYVRQTRFALRALPLTLVLFAATLGAVGWSLARLPSGFVPEEDLGFVVAAVQLPAGASLERTLEVMNRASAAIREVDGVRNVSAFSGFSLLEGQGPSYGTAFVTLEPWDVRTERGQGLQQILTDVRAQVAPIQEASFLVFGLPAIPGIGTTAGFDMRIEDRSGLGRDALANAVDRMVGAASSQSRLQNVYSGFRLGVPEVHLELDRTKAKRLDVPLTAIFDTLQTAIGSKYVNDFNLFDRTYQVNVQAEPRFREKPDDLARLRVRSSDGAMVPLGTLVQVGETLGPDKVTRFNLFPAASMNGAAAPGSSSGEALALMEQIAARELPAGMGIDWVGMSYQEKAAGGRGSLAFALGVLIVFLILAAQYESYALPLAVVLSIPLVILGAAVALDWRGMQNDVFTQIGLVLLVGLGAKNAILIVEFARARRAAGASLFEAAIEAAQTRLRPILMTSLAFILGVLPLAVATGASAASRRALGTAVCGGMIGVTVLGLVFTPALYVVVQGSAEWVKARVGRKAADARVAE